MRALLLAALLAAPLAAQVPPEQCATILITGDGWTKDMEGEFNEFAAKVEGQIFEAEPYKRMKPFFKFVRQFKESEEGGCTTYDCVIPAFPGLEERLAHLKPNVKVLDEQWAIEYKVPPVAKKTVLTFMKDTVYRRKTPFKIEYKMRDKGPLWATFYDDALPVRSVSIILPDEGFKELKKFADEKQIRPDLAIILTPDRQCYAAAADFKCKLLGKDFPAIFMTRGAGDAKALADLMSHELGHALYSLADEYHGDKEDCSTEYIVTYTGLHQVPNIATSPKNPPWQHLIDLGIIRDEPVPGGLMSCPTQVFHPTPSCKMNTNEPPFCPACMERVAHAHISRAKLILSATPSIRKIASSPEQGVKFTVKTCAKDTDPACKPRFLEYWEVDGTRILGTRREDPEGYTYELALEKLPIGTHRVRFGLGDGQLFCDSKPNLDRTGEKKAMPWDTTDWWIMSLPSRVMDPLGLGLLFKKKGWN